MDEDPFLFNWTTLKIINRLYQIFEDSIELTKFHLMYLCYEDIFISTYIITMSIVAMRRKFKIFFCNNGQLEVLIFLLAERISECDARFVALMY